MFDKLNHMQLVGVGSVLNHSLTAILGWIVVSVTDALTAEVAIAQESDVEELLERFAQVNGLPGQNHDIFDVTLFESPHGAWELHANFVADPVHELDAASAYRALVDDALDRAA
jgi:hypothetical protein